MLGCNLCEKEGKFRCARCTVVYCSQDCQRSDWKAGHKQACGKATPDPRADPGADARNPGSKRSTGEAAAESSEAVKTHGKKPQCFVCAKGGCGALIVDISKSRCSRCFAKAPSLRKKEA
jgi:hypothetical protein